MVKRYPEDALEPDQKIFNRLLTTDWRYLQGDLYGPVERRYSDAVKWIEALHRYDSDLREFLSMIWVGQRKWMSFH